MSVDISINSSEFVEMFRAGHTSLKQRVDIVNGLNVFPVPDGDTGTNMELSLAAGLRSMEQERHQGFTAILQSMSTGLLMGARGNSGVILSQLLRGFAKITPVSDSIDVQAFSQALSDGVEIAYRAVAKPVEGTILTVAREAAAVGKKSARKEMNFGRWLDIVVEAAKETLLKTPSMLPVLKNAGVVDSGGQGLVFVLEGFRDFAKGVTVAHQPGTSIAAPELDLDAVHHEGEYGYCTEVLIRTENHPVDVVERSLRERLSTYGDSLLVVGADPLVKVHVHTLHPGKVMEDALLYGPLVKIKVDNMSEQFEEAHGAQENRPTPQSFSEEPETVQGQTEGDVPSPLGSHEDDAVDGPVIVAVAAGQGIVETFKSLGADTVIEGGQTMNPSTEEIVEAVQAALKSSRKQSAIILPNNKNIIMAAEQAKQVLGDAVYVVPTVDIPQGMAALLAFLPGRTTSDNLTRMESAAQATISGQIVRAVRDSVYEDIEIEKGQYMVFVRGKLQAAYGTPKEAVGGAIEAMWHDDAELLTVIYGQDLDQETVDDVLSVADAWPDLEVEVQSGGQPVYDYILALE